VFPKDVAGLHVVSLLLQSVHLNVLFLQEQLKGIIVEEWIELALRLKTHASVVGLRQGKALNWGQWSRSCCVRRRCDGIGLGLVGCWP